MPFKEINVKKEIKRRIDEDKDFAEAYKKVKKEYQMIRQVVDARKKLGLTQRKLADKIGVKQQVISRFEREKHIPTLDNFLKILDALGLEIKIENKKKAH